MRVSINGGTPKWMVSNSVSKWIIRRYPRKPPRLSIPRSIQKHLQASGSHGAFWALTHGPFFVPTPQWPSATGSHLFAALVQGSIPSPFSGENQNSKASECTGFPGCFMPAANPWMNNNTATHINELDWFLWQGPHPGWLVGFHFWQSASNVTMLFQFTMHYNLVGGLNPSGKYESQLGWWHSQYMEKQKMATKPPTSNVLGALGYFKGSQWVALHRSFGRMIHRKQWHGSKSTSRSWTTGTWLIWQRFEQVWFEGDLISW